MVHMLSCFNLAPGEALEHMQQDIARFSDELLGAGLVRSVSRVGRRFRHPVMDTDSDRNLEFYLIITFEDRAQCDRAVAEVFRHEGSLDSAHASVLGPVSDPVFVCWEDL